MLKQGHIGFNNEWAKKVSKKKFVDNHKAAYPDVDLEAEYDKIVPPKQEAPKKGKKP